MANNRIHWGCLAVGIAPQDTSSYVFAHGVQRVGTTTTFNLDDIFELGQTAIYDTMENLPDIEVTLEKVIDGYPLLYHLTTRGAPSNTMIGRSAKKCNVALNIYGDTQDSASGTPVSEVIMSGMFISSLAYDFPVDGPFTESITLVGNNKEWKTSGYLMSGTLSDNTDVPLAYTSGDGGVQRRQHMIFDVTSTSNPDGTILPGGTNGIPGISSSGTNNKTAGVYGAFIQRISVNTDYGREPLNTLGQKGPYFRFMNLPVQVTCDIETYCTTGDKISATEEGVNADGTNLSFKQIYIVLNEGTHLNLGSKNKLQSVTFGGADAGGGNATCTYSFRNNNELTVTHPQDPG